MEYGTRDYGAPWSQRQGVEAVYFSQSSRQSPAQHIHSYAYIYKQMLVPAIHQRPLKYYMFTIIRIHGPSDGNQYSHEHILVHINVHSYSQGLALASGHVFFSLWHNNISMNTHTHTHSQQKAPRRHTTQRSKSKCFFLEMDTCGKGDWGHHDPSNYCGGNSLFPALGTLY